MTEVDQKKGVVTVLVVDDERGMRETLTDILTAAGYEVTSTEEGESALRHMAERLFDVVVMDIRMPGRDGVSILEEVGAPPPRVILMTGYANEERLKQAVASNPFAVLHKPFAATYLLKLVEKA